MITSTILTITFQITADEALSRDDVKSIAHERATEFLSTTLADNPLQVVDIKERAAARAIAWRTVERVKDILGIRSEKLDFGRGWQWRMVENAEGIDWD